MVFTGEFGVDDVNANNHKQEIEQIVREEIAVAGSAKAARRRIRERLAGRFKKPGFSPAFWMAILTIAIELFRHYWAQKGNTVAMLEEDDNDDDWGLAEASELC